MRLWKGFIRDAHRTLGRGSTTLSQLDRYCGALFGRKYTGTFPSESPPTLSASRPYAIINTDTAASGGEHWVALARANDGDIIVFDSFGRGIRELIPSLYNHAQGRGVALVQTDMDADQTEDQEDCGSRCAAWLRLYDEYGEEAAMLV